jgi:UDP-3-O-[3-hydroxymyristoyl] glucosamine N-acyltransferase
VNITLKKISEKFNVEFIGDGSYEINNVSSIANANENSIIFLSDKNF